MNFEADRVFRPVLDRMWQMSPTFRRQCSRLAMEHRTRVKVLTEDDPRRATTSHARTAFTFGNEALATAHVYLRLSLEAPELIAHEMEHILEQLDEVDLTAQAGNGVVWKSARDAYETRRAIEAGRRVAREVMGGPGLRGDSGRAANHVDPELITVRQADRDMTPLSARSARVSGSGRQVVFISRARLVAEDRNDLRDVYVLDLDTRQLSLESPGPGLTASDGESSSADISRDGRYVVFESEAGNLTDGSFPPGTPNVFLRNRATSATTLLTTAADGRPANGPSRNPVINADGTTVVFESAATDLLDARTTGVGQMGIYLIRLASGLRVRVDVSGAAAAAKGTSMSPSISANGRFVAFASRADLGCRPPSAWGAESPDGNGVADIYVRDTETGITTRISHRPAGGDSNGASYDPAISGNGRYVAFVSEATNLTRSPAAREPQVYLHDRVGGTTELVSHTAGGRAANGKSIRPAVSFDGSRIAFQSLASDLRCERTCQARQADVNLVWDVFVHDRHTRQTIRVSEDGGDEWMDASGGPSIDHAGRVLAFGSRHPIDADDENHDSDLFIRFLER